MNKNGWRAVAIAAVAVLVIGASLFVGTTNWGWGQTREDMMWNFGAFGWPMMIFMMLIPFGLVVLGVFALVWLMQNREPRVSPGAETALEILKKRYARGEIAKEEFDQTKNDI